MLRYRINGILVINPDNPEELRGIFTTADLLNLMKRALDKGAGRQTIAAIVADVRARDCPANAACVSA